MRERYGAGERRPSLGAVPAAVEKDLQGDLRFVVGEELLGGDLGQVLQGVVARGDDGPVDLGAGGVLIGGGGGVESGLQDGCRVGVLVEFVVVE